MLECPEIGILLHGMLVVLTLAMAADDAGQSVLEEVQWARCPTLQGMAVFVHEQCISRLGGDPAIAQNHRAEAHAAPILVLAPAADHRGASVVFDRIHMQAGCSEQARSRTDHGLQTLPTEPGQCHAWATLEVP